MHIKLSKIRLIILLIILILVSITGYLVFTGKIDILLSQVRSIFVPGPRVYKIPKFSINQINFTYEEILNAANSNYKIPEGFYLDDLETGDKVADSIYYEGVLDGNNRSSFCTNDFSEAKKLVEQDIVKYNQQEPSEFYPDRTVIKISENEKFFEFKTIEAAKVSDIKYYLRYRVLKCNYVQDIQYNGLCMGEGEQKPNEYVGKFNQRPITLGNVKELAEFLWYSVCPNYNLGNAKVLSSFTEKERDFIKDTIYEIFTINAEWTKESVGASLLKSEYRVDQNTGTIYLSRNLIKKINF